MVPVSLFQHKDGALRFDRVAGNSTGSMGVKFPLREVVEFGERHIRSRCALLDLSGTTIVDRDLPLVAGLAEVVLVRSGRTIVNLSHTLISGTDDPDAFWSLDSVLKFADVLVTGTLLAREAGHERSPLNQISKCDSLYLWPAN